MAKAQNLTVRLEKELVRMIEEEAREEKTDKSTVKPSSLVRASRSVQMITNQCFPFLEQRVAVPRPLPGR
jgi:glutamate racemase